MTTHLNIADIIDAPAEKPPCIIVRTRTGGRPSRPQPHDAAIYPKAGESLRELHKRLVADWSDPCPVCGNDPCECP